MCIRDRPGDEHLAGADVFEPHGGGEIIADMQLRGNNLANRELELLAGLSRGGRRLPGVSLRNGGADARANRRGRSRNVVLGRSPGNGKVAIAGLLGSASRSQSKDHSRCQDPRDQAHGSIDSRLRLAVARVRAKGSSRSRGGPLSDWSLAWGRFHLRCTAASVDSGNAPGGALRTLGIPYFGLIS